MTRRHRNLQLFAPLALLLLGAPAHAQAATTAAVLLAQIERFTLEPDCADDFCAATIVAGGETIVLPRNLSIDLPANRLTARQLFDQAPAACRAAGESGLAASDRCAGAVAGYVTVAANRTRCGQIIAGDVFLQKGLEALFGDVTFIDYREGWFRLDGTPNDASAGTLVRLNDPSGTHSIQAGVGCAGGPNCSPDPRFTNDAVNYTDGFLTGYPLCIPSTIVPVDGNGGFTSARRVGADATTGEGDPFCPQANRPAVAADPVAADSTRFAPLRVGDNVFVNGSFETIGGVRFLSAHTVQVNVGLMTRDDPSQPDFVQVGEMVWEIPSFGFNRVRFRINGQGSLPAATRNGLGTDLDVFALRVDPNDGGSHEDPLASTFNNPGTNGLGSRPRGVNLWRIDYDVTFPPLATKPNQPCTNLLNAGLAAGTFVEKCANGGTLEENFSVLSPVAREIVARTRHKAAALAAAANGGPPVPQTLNLLGLPANQGEYLRPLGISLGGLEPPEPLGIDLDLAAMPFILEGLPWLLDRRVGPGGCPAGGCESTGPFPPGALALAPFPVSGFSPSDVITRVAGASPIVPVFGRPSSFFTFDPQTQLLFSDLLPLPADDACGVRAASVTAAAAAGRSGGGCALAPAGEVSAAGLFLSLLALVWALARLALGWLMTRRNAGPVRR